MYLPPTRLSARLNMGGTSPAQKLDRFELDFYSESLKLAYEYDGPEHYCEVGHIERDERKNLRCREEGITLKRWPYYFQLTRDIARYYFEDSFSEDKYLAAIKEVYKTACEAEVLAPGLHNSKSHQLTLYIEALKGSIKKLLTRQ